LLWPNNVAEFLLRSLVLDDVLVVDAGDEEVVLGVLVNVQGDLFPQDDGCLLDQLACASDGIQLGFDDSLVESLLGLGTGAFG